MTVHMTHPDHDGEFDAQPSQVEHLKLSGWKPADPDADYERWPAELQRFEGQDQVRMRHPDIDSEPITVAKSAEPFHREKGWLVVEAEPDAASEAEPLDARTVPELRELAKARGISPIPATKPELLDALTGEQEPQDQAGDQPAQPSKEE